LDSAGLEHSLDFQFLAREAARALSREGEPSNRDKTQLLAVLHALRKLGRREDGSVSLIDAFSALEEKLGAGYYRFEVRRRMRALSKADAPETSLG
jgi:hypothetical protein